MKEAYPWEWNHAFPHSVIDKLQKQRKNYVTTGQAIFDGACLKESGQSDEDEGW